ncbi:MAG: hypothetical protein HY473_01055 [Candidatus Sungbacteria bacterium]|uniref:EfeO-type cupredoxin-like domain-containing protein n=1 Tax=Candidatus Sungiibacteriota bacterium TaxID=2750080 RepID=A0A933DTH5_9BACT|nr:hypothetical protein [Candidatus Sungbacteria bacterium]
MKFNPKTTIAIIVLLVVIGGAYLLLRGRTSTPSPTPSTPGAAPSETSAPASESKATPPTSAKRTPKTYRILMTPTGFEPSNLTINTGDTVTFFNNDQRLRWPASGMHPTHQICPGFDALRFIPRGESYSFTFKTAKECPFHDHLLPTLFGKITVLP